MAYPVHFLFAMGGGLALPGQEIWECTIRGSYVPGGVGAKVTDWLSQTQSDLTSWFSSPDSALRSDSTITWIKLNEIGADGRYTQQGTTNVLDFAAVAGARTPRMPPFLSLVTTWGTAKTRGPGARGRIYLPNSSAGEPNTGVTTTQDATGIANAGVALLTLLGKTRAAGTFTPQVVSKVNATLTPITTVQCDTLVDVQRRRKNALAGARVVVTR